MVPIIISTEEYYSFRKAASRMTQKRFSDASMFKHENPKTPETGCFYCGLRGTANNPLTAAHRIADIMVLELGITPDYLSRPSNFVWAHQSECNDAVEFTVLQTMRRLVVDGLETIPSYWSQESLELWEAALKDRVAESGELIQVSKTIIEAKPLTIPQSVTPVKRDSVSVAQPSTIPASSERVARSHPQGAERFIISNPLVSESIGSASRRRKGVV